MSDQNEATAPKKWELLDDRLLNTCKVWDLRTRRYRHPQKSDDNEFHYIDSSDWVIVIARTLADELILIRQFRCGINALSWELPGGIIDAGENPITAGLRELREETGYNAENGKYIGCCRPNPAIMNNQCHFVFADKATPDAAGTDWDEHEEIEVRILPEKEVFEWAREQTIEHALALTGLLYYQLFKEKKNLT